MPSSRAQQPQCTAAAAADDDGDTHADYWTAGHEKELAFQESKLKRRKLEALNARVLTHRDIDDDEDDLQAEAMALLVTNRKIARKERLLKPTKQRR